jgi:phosphoribosylformylglycinamidine cyclo-ligase
MDSLRAKSLLVGLNFDGVGTKIEIAERVGIHNSIAFDLFAMVCDDAAIRGAEPLWFGSILDCNKVSVSIVRELALGMVSAAREARVAVVNGEIAELGNRVAGYGIHSYNWGAGVVWAARKDRIITGKKIRRGHAIVGVAEHGFRSNGLSLVRRVFSLAYGPDWHRRRLGRDSLGRAVLKPSRIYTSLMVAITGGVQGTPTAAVSGMCHVTGGGIPGKLSRLLSVNGLGAIIRDPFVPSDVMLECQRAGEIADEEAYRAWNMGQGLLIVTNEPDQVVATAGRFGHDCRVIGEVTREPVIRILSKGADGKGGRYLCFRS